MKNINIKDILRNAPMCTKLYSPIIGECYLSELPDENILVFDETNKYYTFDTEGKYKFAGDSDITTTEECVLFPSKDNRDWNNIQYGPKFNFNLFKPFDKVLMRNGLDDDWFCSIFSHINKHSLHFGNYVNTANELFAYCIPYTDETKHLVGTDQMPPYVYQEIK